MPIGSIVFNKGQGGLGLPLTGQDYVSGLLFYYPQIPAWLASAPIFTSPYTYEPGDRALVGDYVYQCITTNTDNFDPADWTLLYAYAPYPPGAEVLYEGNVYINPNDAYNNDITFTPDHWTNLGPIAGPPTGWANANYVALSGTGDAISNGILPAYNKNNIYADSNFTDAHYATGGYTPAAIGNVNDTTIITANTLTTGGIVVTTLCNYNTTIDDVAGGLSALAGSLAAAINAETATTGYWATVSSDTVLINAPRSQGFWVNANGKLTVTLNSSTVSSSYVTPFTGGTQSMQAIWYYHISEFFRIQPKGLLYVGFNPVPVNYTFSEITACQTFAQGTLRQLGIYFDGHAHALSADTLTADLTAIHNEIVNNNDAYHQPLSALYSANMKTASVSDTTTFINLGNLSANKVSAVISQDGAGLGNFLFQTAGFTIGNIGALLGTVAFGAVSDDIMWVGKFNVSNGFECDTPAFGNGVLVDSVPMNLLDALDSNRYIFLLTYVGKSGTFWNEGNTAITVTSDYAYIEDNRTIDKACRGLYASLLPALGSPLPVNADGTLTNETIAYFTSLAKVNLSQMVGNQELLAFSVVINPTQNVLSTSTLVLTIQLVPVGVARAIQINIGYPVNVQG